MLTTNKKTKVVCTIGPATTSEEKLEALLEAGMNVMRLNFSHGDFAEHTERVVNLRSVMKRTGKCAAILQDLGGPKIRIGTFEKGVVILKEGAFFTLTTDKIVGDEHRVSINYPMFAKEVKKGDAVLLHDGKKRLEVVEVKGNNVKCKIIVGGEIKDKRGVNLPDSELSVSSITEKDRADLEFGIKNDVDFIALSFVRHPEDIIELREILKKRKSTAQIIAKIETPQAVANIDKIIELADGIMVARGDLAIEVPAENVPLIQKMLIKKCNAVGKPVITATQMLESMIKSPVPTRAEVSDIANAILDGTDAIMLSEETTLGDFPIQAVEVMTRVAKRVESDCMHREVLLNSKKNADTKSRVSNAVTSEAVDLADHVGAKFIVNLTYTGRAARHVSRFKPSQFIIALTPHQKTCNQLALSFGVYPILIKKFESLTEAFNVVKKLFVIEKLAVKGDRVIILSGIPFGKAIDTNTILVETI
ncbi:MAG: pyruvate kinase [Candidatus Paceibacterota bacterium]|jgi:pyruvate kinase